jgi:ubiquinone/menaquinone biosynthesis C-methylase UbiE
MSRYDRFKEEFYLARLGTLRGKVLELGFGDADTLLHYGNETEVVAIEKNRKWVEHARKRLAKSGIGHVQVMQGSAEELPFPDGKFDFVTSSFMLCSVGSQREAIAEIYRVLTPGGSYVALEHTLSNNGLFRSIQKILAKPVSKIAGNCHLNSDPLAVIGLQPFRVVKTEYFPYFLEPPMYIEAVKPTGYDAGTTVISKEARAHHMY